MSDMVVTKQICTQCRRKAMQFCTVIYVITGVDLDDVIKIIFSYLDNTTKRPRNRQVPPMSTVTR
jgi:hypothetical protein